MIRGILHQCEQSRCRRVAMDVILGPGADHAATDQNSRAILNTIEELGDAYFHSVQEIYVIYPPKWFDPVMPEAQPPA